MSKEFIVFCLYVIVIAYVVATRRTKYYLPAAVALAVSFAWNYLARGMYEYTTSTVAVLGINIYSLLGWAAGLWFGYMFFRFVVGRLGVIKFWKELVLFNAFYIPILLLLETVAYHFFGVVNGATAIYPGLPVCDCIHAPGWMQAVYLLMGTIFMLCLRLCQRGFKRYSESIDSKVKVS